MKKFIVIFLIFILSSVQVWADCGGVPDWDEYDWASNQKHAIKYKHAKPVYHTTEGKMKTNDTLIIWNKDANELCFFIETYSNDFNNCGIEDKAINVKNNEYIYTQNECHVILKFLKDEVKVNVTGPRGNYCVDDDFGINSSGGRNCGINASVDSATYIRVRKK